MTGVERFSSGGPYEDVIGYSRAVAAGDFVLVSGCTSIVDGIFIGEGDPYEQALTGFKTAEKALAQAGLSRADVVRTRMYLTHARDADAVGRAHKEMFDEVRPAATMVVVAALVDSRMLVEVEVEAYRGAK
ncbi:RidA family protein [Yinghuangia soli]|uniref:RidA family protein n=1 Tax=Yinghuangia soli TaxID=2908204 RepID=A0AA41Q3N9_9ACTN|nr:RidA family protein [Yinghuangia soli]MCF2530405.1 RidA family protein [Yinghuangia soli]